VTFTTGGLPRLGALSPDETAIVDLAARDDRPEFASMQALIEAGPDGLVRARDTAEKSGPTVAMELAQLLAPVPVPVQMRDFVAFEQHLLNAYGNLRKVKASLEPDPEEALARYEKQNLFNVPEIWYKQPCFYKPNRFNVVGTGHDILAPAYTNRIDYEMEMGMWIWKGGKDIPREEAASHIFGYSVFNDISLRDTQALEYPAGLGPGKGKDFDSGKIIGPCIVTADSFDPYSADMVVNINGKEISRGNSSTVHWKFEDTIAHVTRGETIHAGEFFGSGTVGWGSGMEQQSYLKDGDVITLEIEGIGKITNTVAHQGQSK
jgi:2-keto-4-pentenoate hydratase/2-oxohepta-3-ene-1,7-dioic acid hydratase in catechol pathway